tara:strand:+ start:163 stop:495 length:333 start_codon:yes stop_codon:yes gene_type:complete
MPNPYEMYNASSVTHRNKPLTILNLSEDFNNFIENMDDLPHKIAIIPEGVDGRPDLLAHQIYGTEKLWWVIMLANKIDNAKTQLVSGKKIFIPEIPGYAFVIDENGFSSY